MRTYRNNKPFRWADCAVGGHVSFGETAEAALRREASEGIGLSEESAPGFLATVHPLLRFVWETELERELVFVFAAELPPGTALRADPVEVEELWPRAPAELNAELEKGEEGTLTGLVREELKRMA